MSHFEKCCQNNWREEKKGPPLTLHTPGSTAFVLARIMLFHSADKGKHPFFKPVKEKSFFLNLQIRARGLLSPTAIQLTNFRSKCKLIPTVSLSKQQFRGKEDATPLAKLSYLPAGFSQVTTHLFAHQNALTKL